MMASTDSDIMSLAEHGGPTHGVGDCKCASLLQILLFSENAFPGAATYLLGCTCAT